MIEVRKKRSYFLRTFRIMEVMILILLLLCLVRFPLGFIEKKFLPQANGFVLPYVEIMRVIFEWLINAVGLMKLVSIGTISLIGIPELVYRITEDSIMNLLYSIWTTYQIRKFIFNKTNDMESNTGKSRTIQKSIIDIRKKALRILQNCLTIYNLIRILWRYKMFYMGKLQINFRIIPFLNLKGISIG